MERQHLEFETEFVVDAPLEAVTQFHLDHNALKTLTPPPVFIQYHKVEPMAEGSLSNVTMWFGPIPVKWVARHFNVSKTGFSDIQQTGPMKHWLHIHSFTEVDATTTLIKEHIEYEHGGGLVGLFTRLLFNSWALTLLFYYRRIITRMMVKKYSGYSKVV